MRTRRLACNKLLSRTNAARTVKFPIQGTPTWCLSHRNQHGELRFETFPCTQPFHNGNVSHGATVIHRVYYGMISMCWPFLVLEALLYLSKSSRWLLRDRGCCKSRSVWSPVNDWIQRFGPARVRGCACHLKCASRTATNMVNGVDSMNYDAAYAPDGLDVYGCEDKSAASEKTEIHIPRVLEKFNLAELCGWRLLGSALTPADCNSLLIEILKPKWSLDFVGGGFFGSALKTTDLRSDVLTPKWCGTNATIVPNGKVCSRPGKTVDQINAFSTHGFGGSVCPDKNRVFSCSRVVQTTVQTVSLSYKECVTKNGVVQKKRDSVPDESL